MGCAPLRLIIIAVGIPALLCGKAADSEDFRERPNSQDQPRKTIRSRT